MVDAAILLVKAPEVALTIVLAVAAVSEFAATYVIAIVTNVIYMSMVQKRGGSSSPSENSYAVRWHWQGAKNDKKNARVPGSCSRSPISSLEVNTAML